MKLKVPYIIVTNHEGKCEPDLEDWWQEETFEMRERSYCYKRWDNCH
jgi:hypothetical protein